MSGGAISAAMAVVAVAAGAAPSAASERPRVAAVQPLATLLTDHKAVASLHSRQSRMTVLSATRPVTGGPTVLPVTGHATRGGIRWLRVRLPGRPNGSEGWITRRGTRLGTTRWHLLVRTDRRRVDVYRDGNRVRTFAAVVGKASTPTPHGRFFVEESVRMLPGSAGAPFALALSARSDVLQEFDGGPGQIALHGTANLAGALGTAASHGCVRLAGQSIGWLAARIAPGVPVTIAA